MRQSRYLRMQTIFGVCIFMTSGAAGFAQTSPIASSPSQSQSRATVAPIADAAALNKMAARFAPVALRADTSGLSAGDKVTIVKLIDAAKIIDTLQLRQRWANNEALWLALKKDRSALGLARQKYFWLNKGPWSIIDGNQSFLPANLAGFAIPAVKPDAANFYPAGASKADIEKWVASLAPADKDAAQWFFTTIRAGRDGQFKVVKYSDEYRVELQQLSTLLKAAAAAADNVEEISELARGCVPDQRLSGIRFCMDGSRFDGRCHDRTLRDLQR